ncbi:hypothetical protein [Larkinella insperata]|nr:hypothetical protein [Larkinella insperata]
MANLRAQDLDFATTGGGWTSGSLSKSYTTIGSPATNVSVVITGTTTGFQANQPAHNANGLGQNMNFTSNTHCITTTITFSPGISNLSFLVRDVDRGALATGGNGAYNYVDQVIITGQNGAAAVTPAIGAASVAGANTVVGNVITGTNNNVAPVNTVLFSGLVTQVVIQYCNGPNVIANPGTQGVTIGDLSWEAAPLPVRLVSFQGQVRENNVVLNWETASEENSERFDLERSTDALEFERIGQQPAVGTSQARQFYTFTDENPQPGMNYYRLHQVDYDGQFENSKPIAVEFKPADAYLKVYFASFHGICVETGEPSPHFRVLTPAGRSIQHRVETLGDNRYLLHLSPAPNGLVIFQLVTKNGVFTKKLLNLL